MHIGGDFVIDTPNHGIEFKNYRYCINLSENYYFKHVPIFILRIAMEEHKI